MNLTFFWNNVCTLFTRSLLVEFVVIFYKILSHQQCGVIFNCINIINDWNKDTMSQSLKQ